MAWLLTKFEKNGEGTSLCGEQQEFDLCLLLLKR